MTQRFSPIPNELLRLVPSSQVVGPRATDHPHPKIVYTIALETVIRSTVTSDFACLCCICVPVFCICVLLSTTPKSPDRTPTRPPEVPAPALPALCQRPADPKRPPRASPPPPPPLLAAAGPVPSGLHAHLIEDGYREAGYRLSFNQSALPESRATFDGSPAGSRHSCIRSDLGLAASEASSRRTPCKKLPILLFGHSVPCRYLTAIVNADKFNDPHRRRAPTLLQLSRGLLSRASPPTTTVYALDPARQTSEPRRLVVGLTAFHNSLGSTISGLPGCFSALGRDARRFGLS